MPQLMMGFTADGQSNTTLVESRDRRFGIDSQKKSDRADIQTPAIDPAADAWQRGERGPHKGKAADPAKVKRENPPDESRRSY